MEDLYILILGVLIGIDLTIVAMTLYLDTKGRK